MKTIVFLLSAMLFFAGLLSAQEAATKQENRVLEIKGTLEIWRKDGKGWEAAKINDVVFPGDRLRTGLNSRATVQLSIKVVHRMEEVSEITIAPPSTADAGKATLDFQNGTQYFLGRDKPQFNLRARMAVGAIRGTEFVVQSDEQQMILTMIEGEVALSNSFGSVELKAGEEGVIKLHGAPTKTAAINALNKVQWCLYYPGVLNLNDLQFDAAEKEIIEPSLKNWREGDLPRAAETYPSNRQPKSDSEKIYRAALLLGSGQVEKAEKLLSEVRNQSNLADAIRKVIASVRFELWNNSATPQTATEWLAESYYQNSRSDLKKALAAARSAVEKSSDFGFGWERVAELEFSFGHTKEALAALNKSLEISPRNAQAVSLKGFLLAAEGKMSDAQNSFEQAMAIDSGLANPWLGRGLVRIARGHIAEGRSDLQIAAAMEPNRALLRSYLGKAFSMENDYKHALRELALAQEFDPRDPTSYLYAALLKRQLNQVNAAVKDLEKSKELNNNRSVFRSKLLLEQDRAVRGANLASIYQDAGMIDVSTREASRALQSDYGNYSSHLFLANSYDALRDPRQITLRYETPWQSEYLLANLLAPVGAGALSPTISQQEYSKLFERDRFGFVSSSEYLSRGDWIQDASQFGKFGNTAYSIDLNYRSEHGERPNNDFEQITVSPQIKQQLDEKNSIYLQATYYNAEAGDVFQYYDPTNASTTLRTKERQEPLLLAGFHHEWSPGVHTLVLAGRLDDTYLLNDPLAPALIGTTNSAGTFTRIPYGRNTGGSQDLDYRSELAIYTAEAQQLFKTESHSLISGIRFQTGDFDTSARQVLLTNFPSSYMSSTHFDKDFSRFSLYGYDNWQIVDSLLFTAGLTYDRLRYPQNFRSPPINNQDEHRDIVSPKFGLTWTPCDRVVVRGYYAQSLGGVSFDQSFRLEPVQIAGFTQGYRSLVPEQLTGATAGAEFETWGAGIDTKITPTTYAGVQGEVLRSDIRQTVGAFEQVQVGFIPGTTTILAPLGLRQKLDYEERSVIFNVNQLVGDEWAFGARDRLSHAKLDASYSTAPGLNSKYSALLNQLNLYAIYHHRCGFFARAESVWSRQDNYSPSLAGDDFWQFNLFVGYRIRPRRVEFQVGLLNLTDQDYHLNPINLYQELPRDRTLALRVKLSF